MITIHIVWFDEPNKIHSTGKDYSGDTLIDCIKAWQEENPNGIYHSSSIKQTA